MLFSELGLIEPITRAITEAGYTTPTPIQAQAIPAIMKGGDLLAGAQTGTGKTAGFTLPILNRLATVKVPGNANGTKPLRALILTPTRELAAQVEESVKTYGKYLPLKSMVMFGGVGPNPQIRALKQGVDICVATPGRLLDLHSQGAVNLSRVEIFVLDEADRMLDMGFIHDIKKLLKLLPDERQNLLFSATFSDEIKELADRLLSSPAMIEVARRNTTAETISQKVHPVARAKKRDLLAHLVKSNDWHQVLVFCRTKHGANRLAEQLNKDDITAMAIHGNKSQGARTKALAEFKAGTLQVLVATDIAARGIDIDQLPHVINYDLPNISEDYVHRIGRTGRAGATGEAISLVCADDVGFLRDIERLIKREIPKVVVKGFEPDPNEKAEDVLARKPPMGRGGHAGGRVGAGGGNRGGQTAGRAPAKTAAAKTNAPARGGQPQPAGKKPGGGFGGARTGNANGNRAPLHRTGGRGR